MDEEAIILRDMIEKRPCRIDMERREQLVARFGHPEAFTRDGLKDEYIIDYATGIRTRRTLEERIIWKFDPQGALLDELKTLCAYPTPEPEPIKAQVASFTPEARTEILKLVHSPKPGAPCKAARTGFPQRKVAEWFKVTEKEVSRWDNGKSTPPPGYSLALRQSGNWDEMETVLKAYRDLKSLKPRDVYSSKRLVHTDNAEFIDRHRLK